MQNAILIHVDYCLTPRTTIHNAALLIQDGRILAVGGYSAFADTSNYHLIELPDCYLMPGLVDTHLYGAGGYDCMRADTDPDMTAMSRILATHGVTTFLPTTQSCATDKLQAIVTALAKACDLELPGALPAGLTVEGPFLSAAKRGAHSREALRAVDLDETSAILAAGRGRIRILTFAPEQRRALELIALLVGEGIVPCMGHTVANEAQVRAAIDAGATRCAHLYNGMEPLKQRRVGLAAIALTDERVYVELISDGIHIHPGMIDLACRCKPKDKLLGISNAIEAAGLEDGIYRLGEETIVVSRGISMLRGGVLAGATSFLDRNYSYLRAKTHLTAEEAAACFTVNPARSIGLDDRGEIKPGKRADLAIMSGDHQVQMTIVGGRIVYDRHGRAGQLTPECAQAAAGRPLPA
jgi:N-acetylglucosamine-6-phosphate deacetylase